MIILLPFQLLERNIKRSADSARSVHLEKLKLLSGIESVSFGKVRNEIVPDNQSFSQDVLLQPDEQSLFASHNTIASELSARSQIEPIQKLLVFSVNSVGFKCSQALLRLLLGHDGFVGNVFTKFDLMLSKTEEDSENNLSSPSTPLVLGECGDDPQAG